METSAKATDPFTDKNQVLKNTAEAGNIEINIEGYGTVIQKPLSFFGKNELFAIVAQAIDKAISQGFSITKLLDSIDIDEEQVESLSDGNLSMDDLSELEDLATLIMKLLATVPDLLQDAYLIFLNVSAENRGRCRIALQNIDDETGFLILNTFVEQNGQAVRDFLPQWWAQVKKMWEMRTPDEPLTASNDLKNTQPTTLSQ